MSAPVLPESSSESFARAFAAAQAKGTQRTAELRLLAAGLFLGLVGAFTLLTARRDWAVYLGPLAAYLGLAVAAFAGRKSAFALKLAAASAVADVALVWHVQAATLPLSPHPAGVAGFSLGLFALVVVMNGGPLRGALVGLAAASGAILEIDLLHRAGVSRSPMVMAAAVLGVLALATYALMHRLRRVAGELAAAETSRRVAEAAAEAEARRNEALVELQREKDRLTQLLVHDLRSPLTSLVGNIDYLAYKLDGQATPKLLGMLQAARRTSARLGVMLEDLLDVTKLEDRSFPLHRRPILIGDLLREACREVEPLLEGRGFALLAPSPDVRVEVDPKLIRRVVDNLLGNALRYTPAKGRLEVRATAREGRLCLRLCNQGPAIEPAVRAQMFEKYRRGGTKGGSGLGLYFCRLAVEAHGGTIGVEDAPGWDVAFVIELPVSATAASPSAPPPAAG